MNMILPFVRGRLFVLRRITQAANAICTRNYASKIQDTQTARKYASKVPVCDAHMNELPIPCGSWDVYYKSRQSFYAGILVFGIVWWLIGLVVMIYTDSFFLNWAEPERPSPPSDMIDECE